MKLEIPPRPIVLKSRLDARADGLAVGGLDGLSGRDWCVGAQFRKLPKVLGGRCEEELISGAIGSAEAQQVEPEYALEVSEEHLDLLASLTRRRST
jgi:hypothetical protein